MLFPKGWSHGLWNSLPKDESKCCKETGNSEEGGKSPSTAIFREMKKKCGAGQFVIVFQGIIAVSLLSSPCRGLPDMGTWARWMLPPVGYDSSCLLRDLWWLSQERGSLQNTTWKRHCSCSTTLAKTNKPKTRLGKNVPLWCSPREWQRTEWKNPPSSTATHSSQGLPQKFSTKYSGL